MNHKFVLSINNLKKRYQSGFEIGAVNLNLTGGHVVAFLGINGAGKSTLFSMLAGNLDPSSGSVEFNDQRITPDSYELKHQIGYLPQNLPLPKWVSAVDTLNYAASLYSLKDRQERVAAQLQYWDCEGYKHRPLGACSHGMQKRVALALATLNEPPILILDEPFSGLDLSHVRSLNEAITRRQAKGELTILSTHIPHYVAKLCQQVHIIKSGKVDTIEAWSDQAILERLQTIENQFY